MFHKILSANDGSPSALKALEVACDLAARYGSDLHMIVVEEVPALPAAAIAFADQARAEADKVAQASIRLAETVAERCRMSVKTHLFAGEMVRNVVDFAKHHAFDLLVIGVEGRTTVYELESRADRIAHLAPCPVLIVK